MSGKNRLTVIMLLALTLIGLISTIPIAEGYTGQKIAEYISSPLPSAPEPVLQGADFPVTVKDLSSALEGGEATAWSGVITSIYGSYTVPLVNGTYDGEKWLLYFNLPEDVHVGLYNLTLTQITLRAHQSRCVWVLDEWSDSITFGHITDIHEPIGELVYPAYIMQTNIINPDFVIATGDIVQTESNARAWAYLQYTMLQQEYPSFLLPGNHDYSGYGGRAYTQYGGKLNYTLVMGDFVVIATDTGENGYFKEDQITWLESELAKYPDKVKIIGFHHAFLSSEYEEDLGAVTGGYIEVDWENIDELADTMYFTWKDDDVPRPVSQELMRIIQEYDVRLILTGHVHRDMIYIVNNQHYFVTTSTTGGGLPPESRFGSRLITVDSDGTVHLDPYAEENLANPPNNLPTGYVTYTYSSANDFTGTAVSASVDNNLDIAISEGRLIFKVSDSKQTDAYEFIGEQPTRVETTTTSNGYVFDAYFDIPAHTSFLVTLKAEDDATEPMLDIELAESYQSETATLVTLSASDYGWGLKSIAASYSVDDGATWTPVEASIAPILNGEVYKDNFAELDVTFEVPPLFEGESLIVKAEAIDYAGNTAHYQSSDLTVTEPTMYTLTIASESIDVSVTIDSEDMTLPYSGELETGSYQLTVLEKVTKNGKEYIFKKWSDGSTSTTISVDLSEDVTLTLEYEEVETETEVTPPESDTEPANGGGIPIPPSSILIGLIVATIYHCLKKPQKLF